MGVVSIQTAIEASTEVPAGKGEWSRRDRGWADTPRRLGCRRCLRIVEDNWLRQGASKNQGGGLSETEEELFRRVQDLRNALVHFTADVDVETVKMELAWVLIGSLGMFAAGEERDQGEMQTHARFLDPENFKRLTNFRAVSGPVGRLRN